MANLLLMNKAADYGRQVESSWEDDSNGKLEEKNAKYFAQKT